MPPSFRRVLGDTPMIFCNVFEGCLCVYPRADFDDKVINRFKDSDMLDSEMNAIKRVIFASTQELAEDKQGRVSLNSAFIEACGMSKNIITIGVYDHVEIWDEAVYNEQVKSTDFKAILAQFKSSRNKI